MEYDKFWCLIWKLVAVVACTGMLSITSCMAHRSHLIGEAIKQGKDPIAARCAFRPMDGSRSVVCAIIALEKSK